MKAFSFDTPARMMFGRGARDQVADAALSLGRFILVVRGTSVPWVDTFIATLRSRGGSVHEVVQRGEPGLTDVDTAVEFARGAGVDVIVSVGGGSVIDLGKAISGLVPSRGASKDHLLSGIPLADPLPFVAVPTTAGTGAEATRNAVITLNDQGRKVSLRDARLMPDVAIVDPALTDGTSTALTLASGLDAITQLIESYLSHRATPLTDALCRDMIAPAVSALRILMDGESSTARDAMSRASFASGIALANSGLGIVHGLASVIGGRGAAHGVICGRLLPAALRVNHCAAQARGVSVVRFNDVRDWLGTGLGAEGRDAYVELNAFISSNGLQPLDSLGFEQAEFPSVVQDALNASSTKANPIELTADEVTRILSESD